MVGLLIYGRSVYDNNLLSNTCYRIFAVSSAIVLQSVCYKLYVYFRMFDQTPFFEIPSLTQKNWIKFDSCCSQTTRNKIVRHKKRCSTGSLTCHSCNNFSTKSRAENIYHIDKKHSEARARVVHKCKICGRDFLSFYFFWEHERKENWAQRK